MKPIFLSLLFPILLTCNTIVPATKGNPLLSTFTVHTLTNNTLKFSTTDESFELVANDSTKIADTLLAKHLTPILVERLSFTGSGDYYAGQQIAIDNSKIGCIVHTKDNWFKKTSLLMYDKNKQQFYDVVDIAQFYGGDGGVEYIVSWLYKNNSGISLFSRTLGRSYIPKIDEKTGEALEVVEENNSENNALFKWNVPLGKFMPEVMADSVSACAEFHHIQE